MFNLSLSGCGFLGIYHIGVISAFKEHAPEIVSNKISGCSAGSLAAACALCDCCLGQMVSDTLEIACKARNHALGPLHPSFSIVDILRNGLRRILPIDAHKICSGKLYVSLTRWRDNKNFLVNHFDTREELIQALICSSFVPCYSGFIPPKFKGTYYWDGGLSNNNPILDPNTIVVSPFGGESDICPREESASYYCFEMQGTNIQWSRENLYRLSKALFPPSPQVLKAICFRGYKDAVNFLKSRNMLHCSCQRLPREKFSISSVIGEDLSNFRVYDSDESDEENEGGECQVQQYAKTIEPLEYQEMPQPVCEILDVACNDHQENLLNNVYNSKFTRAISICFLPWTLPVELSIKFTRRLVEALPRIQVADDSSKNLANLLLVYVNYIIQKVTYDKYQYHERVSCKLCVHKKPHREIVTSTITKSTKLCPRHRLPTIDYSSVRQQSLKLQKRKKYTSESVMSHADTDYLNDTSVSFINEISSSSDHLNEPCSNVPVNFDLDGTTQLSKKLTSSKKRVNSYKKFKYRFSSQKGSKCLDPLTSAVTSTACNDNESIVTLDLCDHETFQTCNDCKPTSVEVVSNETIIEMSSTSMKRSDQSINDFDAYLDKLELNVLGINT